MAPVELGDRFALYVEETVEVGAGLAVFKPDPDSRIELRLRDESGATRWMGRSSPRRIFTNRRARFQNGSTWTGWTEDFLRDFRGLLLLRTKDESEFAPLGLRFGKGTGALSAVPLIPGADPGSGGEDAALPGLRRGRRLVGAVGAQQRRSERRGGGRGDLP